MNKIDKSNLEKNKTKSFLKIGIGLLILLVITGLISLCIFLFKTLKNAQNTFANDVKVYKLSSKSANFSYNDGLFINSEIQNVLAHGNVTITSDKFTENDILDVEFKIDGEKILGSSSFFTGLNTEFVGYNELFKKLDYSNSTFSLSITYMLDNKRTTEDLVLEKERLLDKKDIPKDLKNITSNDDNSGKKYFDEQVNKTLSLENKGFQWNGCCLLERTFDNGDTLTIRADGTKARYVNKEHAYSVTSVFWGKEHTYQDDNYSFSYYTPTNEITCTDKDKCPSDGYELIKDYLELYNHLWD